MDMNRNTLFFRNDANYLSGIGYNTYGSASTALTFFSDKYRYMEFRQTYSNFLLAKFYFSISADYSYTDFYGDFAFNKGHWTGGIESDLLPYAGHNMATLYPNSHWYGALGTSSKLFAAAYINHVYYSALTSISDLRVKENIVNIESGLKMINLLRPVRYDIKSSYYDSIPEEARQTVIDMNKNSVGFIAQEVQEVLPDLVNEIPGADLYG